MPSNSFSERATARHLLDASIMPPPRSLPLARKDSRLIARLNGSRPAAAQSSFVKISPQHAVARRSEAWGGITAEIVQATSHEPLEYRFKAPVHLLIVHEQGVRLDGETFIENLPRSKLHDVTRKLTFVPAGHEYHELQHPRVPAKLLYFYLDPATPPFGNAWSDVPLLPRLFFEDAPLWGTAIKLKRMLEETETRSQSYVEALRCVLAHELSQLGRANPREKVAIRGGLASWQQRVVTKHIEEHLAESISLSTLASMVRLSRYYFCRAFKQSLGMPPHRYHMSRRIERAKVLLAERKHSVTDVGLTLGFSDTSSLTAAFRRMTGMTPSAYRRNLI